MIFFNGKFHRDQFSSELVGHSLKRWIRITESPLKMWQIFGSSSLRALEPSLLANHIVLFSLFVHVFSWWQLKYFILFTPDLWGNLFNLTSQHIFFNGVGAFNHQLGKYSTFSQVVKVSLSRRGFAYT